MIEKLKMIPVYQDQLVTEIQDGKFVTECRSVAVSERYPSPEEMMEKINEVIEYINTHEVKWVKRPIMTLGPR